jgi:hypothetical protein
MKIGIYLVCLSAILMSCAKPGSIPENLLRCPEEPVPSKSIKTEKEFLQWIEGVRESGNICRVNLKAIEKIVGPSVM